MFVDWITEKDKLHWLSQETNFLTLKSFFTSEQFVEMKDLNDT